MRKAWLGLLVIGWLLAACGAPTALPATATPAAPTSAPTAISPTPAPTVDPFFASQGGGEPRTAGYWLLWNSCAEGNKAGLAAANGGREAGWIILDDLLADPGILLGESPVQTCQQGIRLLQVLDLDGGDRAGDVAFELAARLLAAQLNLAAGAEYCPAVDQAVQAGQLLILSLGFDGSGQTPGLDQASEDRDLALFLVEQLSQYNAGSLCR
jgi:hypothetical protein